MSTRRLTWRCSRSTREACPSSRGAIPRSTSVGEWVATLGMEELPLALGVLSVPPRRIAPLRGQLGVQIVGDSEAKIGEIARNSPAQSAGLKTNDAILQINGKLVHNQSELLAALGEYRPGAKVKLVVKRGDKRLDVAATLGTIRNAATERRDLQNLGGPGVSRRHDDFPRVLQHDTVGRQRLWRSAGGSRWQGHRHQYRPGRPNGNLRRPTEVLLGLMYDLMSGRLSRDDTGAAQTAGAREETAAGQAGGAEVRTGEARAA